MSFRSRTRTVQPVTAHRRASSLNRGSNGTSSMMGGGLQNGLSAYTSNSGYRPSSVPYSNYQNSYGSSSYGSKENLYSPRSTGSGGYFDYSANKRRDSYGSSTSLNALKYGNVNSSSSSSYSSPYKDYDRHGSNHSNSSSYSSPYKDRYVSPYANYDKGVTTAGLNISYNNGNSKSSTNPYSAASVSSRLAAASHFNSGSNGSLNSYPGISSLAQASAKVGRSQSMRDQERKSRSRSRSAAVSQATRSLSVSSLASEGYESGTEQQSSRSRVGSTHDIDSSENGELIDYKALYEAAKAENDKLKVSLRKKDEDLVNVKGALDRFTNATTKNSLSELEKREKRAMERKISEMEEELKQLDALKTENQRLKDENGALIRVISKLSK